MKKLIVIALMIALLALGTLAFAGDMADIEATRTGDAKILSARDFWEAMRNHPEARACQGYIDSGLKDPVTEADVVAYIYNGTVPDAARVRAGMRTLQACVDNFPGLDATVVEIRK